MTDPPPTAWSRWRAVVLLAMVLAQLPLLRRTWLLVPAMDASLSPSSDVLVQSLPFPDAGVRLTRLARELPESPGVVVGFGAPDVVTAAYFVIAMRTWPRQVSLVLCEPTPAVEQFWVPFDVPQPSWRIDLHPGSDVPLRATPTTTADPRLLCATPIGHPTGHATRGTAHGPWLLGHADVNPLP